MVTSTHHQVKDAAEALVAVLKEVSLELDSPNASQEQQQSTMIESLLESSNKAAKEIFNTSNSNFDAKMEAVIQQLASIEVAIGNVQKETNNNLSNENFDAKMDTASERLCAVKEAIDFSNEKIASKVDALKDEIKSNSAMLRSMRDTNKEIKAEMSAVKILLEAQEKQRKVEFQISCAEFKSFTYYSGNSSEEKDSSDLVTGILKHLALRSCSLRPTLTTSELSNDEEGREDFRDKLKKQLTYITGNEVRLVKRYDGRYSIKGF